MIKLLLEILFICLLLEVTGCGKNTDQKFENRLDKIAEKNSGTDENIAVEAKTSDNKVTNSKKSNMIFVQGGTFQMGSDEDQYKNNAVHEVTLSDFYMSRYEVTKNDWYIAKYDNINNLFKKIKAIEEIDLDKAIALTNEFVKYDENNNLIKLEVEKPSDPNIPISADWYEAINFCNWLSENENLEKCYTFEADKKFYKVECNFKATGYRLPTEAEWEYAAKGGNKGLGYNYSGDSSCSDIAWYIKNSEYKPHKGGTKKPNELGLYDMTGNMWEWCWDKYGDYNIDPQTNPTGSATGFNPVLRGGGWKDNEMFCSVSYRANHSPNHCYDCYGFRVVRNSK